MISKLEGDELGGYFIRQMEKLQLCNDHTIRRLKPSRSFYWNRQFLGFFAQLCRLNIMDQELAELGINTGPLVSLIQLLDLDRWRRAIRSRSLKFSLSSQWPLLAEILYFYCLHCAFRSLILQYRHDYHLFKYNRFLADHSGRSGNRSCWQSGENISATDTIKSPDRDFVVGRFKCQLEGNFKLARADLEASGAIFIDGQFSSQIIFIYYMLCTILTYMQGSILNLARPFYFRLSRIISNPWSEQRSFLRTICDEANNFLTSSRSYKRQLLELCRGSSIGCDPESVPDCYRFEFDESSEPANYRRAARHHQQAVEWLRQMALDGSLKPLNWDIKWLSKLSDWCCIFTISNTLLLFATVLLTLFVAPQVVGTQLVLSSTKNWIAFAELFALTCFAFAPISFYIIVLCFGSLDQLKYIRELRELLDGCSTRNQLRFMELTGRESRPSKKEVEELCSWMNRELLFAFLHYKIFQAGSGRSNFIQGAIAYNGCILFIALPSLCRLHMPYFKPAVKDYVLGISIAIIFLFNLTLAPICQLRSRSLELYVSLSGLLAQTIGTSRYGDVHGREEQIYDKHLVWLIRKELNHPAQIGSKFETRYLGVEFNRETAIKMNFWFGFILISLIHSSAIDGVSIFVSQWLRDPFRLMS